MAQLTCGNCGQPVAVADVTCPHCDVLLAAYASAGGSVGIESDSTSVPAPGYEAPPPPPAAPSYAATQSVPTHEAPPPTLAAPSYATTQSVPTYEAPPPPPAAPSYATPPTTSYATPSYAAPPSAGADASTAPKPLFDLNVTAEDVARVADGDTSAASLVTVGDEDPLAADEETYLAQPSAAEHEPAQGELRAEPAVRPTDVGTVEPESTVEEDLPEDQEDDEDPEEESIASQYARQFGVEVTPASEWTTQDRSTPRRQVWASGTHGAVTQEPGKVRASKPRAVAAPLPTVSSSGDGGVHVDDPDDLWGLEEEMEQPSRHPQANVAEGATEDYLRKIRERAGIPVDANTPLSRRIEERSLSREDRRQQRVARSNARQQQAVRDQRRAITQSRPSTFALAVMAFLWLGLIVNVFGGEFSMFFLIITVAVTWQVLGGGRK